MGCSGSKQEDDVYSGVAMDSAPESPPVSSTTTTAIPAPVPEKMDKKTAAKMVEIRKQITAVHADVHQVIQVAKPNRCERIGLEVMVKDQRAKLLGLEERLTKLLEERTRLLEQTWATDAETIHAATESPIQKDKLIGILCNRTFGQIELIAAKYEAEYNETLVDRLQSVLKTAMGSLITGASTGLCDLLVYRCTSQPKRDAALLYEFTNKMNDEALIETIVTRTNEELRKAIEVFDAENEKTFAETLTAKCSYQNYRNFMLKMIDCQRDESGVPFNDASAKKLAEVLYDAGGGRSIGSDPDVFIEHLCNMSPANFEQVNNKYKNKNLKKDIHNKLGGSFETAILARVTNKYDYLANRIDSAMRGMSTDKETVCRILGYLRLDEFIPLRDAYAATYGSGPKDVKCLETGLKNALKKGNYLLACSTLMSDALDVVPLGSFKEQWQDDIDVHKDGNRFHVDGQRNYRRDHTLQCGENNLSKYELGATSPQDAIVSVHDMDVDASNIPNWDGKAKYGDTLLKVQGQLANMQKSYSDIKTAAVTLADEIEATKNVHFSLLKLLYEIESWIRIYTGQLDCLRLYVSKRN